MVDSGHIGALQILRIPFDALAYFRSQREITDQNGFGQTTGIAKVGHRTRFVLASNLTDKFPFLTLVAISVEWVARQRLLWLFEVLKLFFWQEVVVSTIVIGREQHTVGAHN